MSSLPLIRLPLVVGLALAAAAGQSTLQGQDKQTLETPALRFAISPETCGYEITDKRTNVSWKSNPYAARFGSAAITVGGKEQKVSLGSCAIVRESGGLVLTFHPLAALPDGWLRVSVRADGDSLALAYAKSEALPVQNVDLLDDALWTTASDKGYALVPVRMGLLVPADSGLKFSHAFRTYEYEGFHMEMLGLVKQGSAALLTWDDTYAGALLKSDIPAEGTLKGQQVLSTSFNLRKPGSVIRIRLLGRSDYLTIAKAYREVAAQRGLVDQWTAKVKQNPERAKLIGAINFKLWALLDREMNAESTEEKVVKVNWTFDEAAQVAAHLKNDLQLDRVLFSMGGWTRRGYDNQHPDIMPANPECGGNQGLADSSRRIRDLGYLVCLHDNYQDIYRDSPSWNEDLIMRKVDGSLVEGGVWWGGQAYLTCSKQALGLAKRPQNLTEVKEVSRVNSYFIDTTYASGLQECFALDHPLTRDDDMKWKIALSDYARQTFGVFGSEDGREWAIPHSDFMEGLVGVDGTYFHSKDLLKQTGGIPIPLFEMVYRDTQAVWGKYGFDIAKAADNVLYHIRIGRTLYYHEVPPHLYWKEKAESPAASASSVDPALFVRADGGWAEGLHPFDRFVKNTYEILSPLYELTAQMQVTQFDFLTPDHNVTRTVFGEGPARVEAVVNASDKPFRWKCPTGGDVMLPPQGFVIDSAAFAAFHALEWNGLKYDSAPLFTVRSLDGKPVNRSASLRIYHGFGDQRIRTARGIMTVARESR